MDIKFVLSCLIHSKTPSSGHSINALQHNTKYKQSLNFTWIAWSTFAQIITRSSRLETNPMDTLVMLTWWRLWIHEGHLRWNFAEFSRKITRTNALVVIDTIHASSTILAHVILTIVYVNRTVIPFKTG